MRHWSSAPVLWSSAGWKVLSHTTLDQRRKAASITLTIVLFALALGGGILVPARSATRSPSRSNGSRRSWRKILGRRPWGSGISANAQRRPRSPALGKTSTGCNPGSRLLRAAHMPWPTETKSNPRPGPSLPTHSRPDVRERTEELVCVPSVPPRAANQARANSCEHSPEIRTPMNGIIG